MAKCFLLLYLAFLSNSPNKAVAVGYPVCVCGRVSVSLHYPAAACHPLCVCCSDGVSLLDRRGLPEDGGGDDGGAGLVSGPAGDNPDVPLRQRHGLQQGTNPRIFLLLCWV